MYSMLVGKPPFETTDVKTTYRRIKMIAYAFPEHIPLSAEAKDLIEKILVSDPLARPSITEIEEHPFFLKNPVPKFLPSSTLAVPPSSSYLRQFEKANRPYSRVKEPNKPKVPRSSSQPHKEENKSEKKEEARASSGERNQTGSGLAVKKHATSSLYTLVVGGPRL